MQPDFITAASFIPRSLMPPSSWIGHTPFAAWFIEQKKPDLLVELGTHTGNSYFSFCQSVLAAALNTRCYAVDTWQGDSQAGYYGDEVYSQVKTYNDMNYGHFSSLLRMTFDEAAANFDNSSVDLLHIDGLHTYDAVRHDFETWLPKLTSNAFVLFHDTSVREGDFGVWKFWREIKQQYPCHFEFFHSNGLGVLQISDSAQFDWLIPNTPVQMGMRNYFSALGTRQRERYELKILQERFTERGDYVDELNRAMEQGAQHISILEREKKELEREKKELGLEVNEKDQQLIRLAGDLQLQREALSNAEECYHAIVNSTTWKVTFPFRRLLTGLPWLRQVGRRTAQLVWWALTGKLRQRLQDRNSILQPIDDVAEQGSDSDKTLSEVARPLDIDYSVAVPFSYPCSLPEMTPTLAVFCHLFYEEQVHEFRRYLGNIPFSFDLYISTDTDFKKTVIEKALNGWNCGKLDIRVMPNCGRDIAPKLVGFRDVYDDYEYVLHLHSKRSEHDSVLEHWRGFLLENLLGSEAIVRSIISAFEQRADLGMVASQHFEPVRHWINWGGNFSAAETLAQTMGIRLQQEQLLDFPSGSMFWARTAALGPLLEAGLKVTDFAEEAGQIDATLAHAIERLYYYVCEAAGFKWLKISMPDLFAQTPAIIEIDSPDALDRYIDEYHLQLTGDDLPAPRKKHPKPIEQPAQGLIVQRQGHALGSEVVIPATTKIAVGIVTYNNKPSTIQSVVASTYTALEKADLKVSSSIFVIDNGRSTAGDWNDGDNLYYLPSSGNIGFGAAHNRLMAEAFQSGADLYIATNPDGIFHPDAISALVRMMCMHQKRALIEALQFPQEHPKEYDPFTFATPWASGACLMIPASLYAELGGFDSDFFMYCEDVDLSWRARANGFAVLTCPNALFLHDVEDRSCDEAVRKLIFSAGKILAHKWGADDFATWLDAELMALGEVTGDKEFTPVPELWHRYADFKHQLCFAKTRWLPYE